MKLDEELYKEEKAENKNMEHPHLRGYWGDKEGMVRGLG